MLKNYRPVSNLQYISKLTEKAVFQQTHSHMTINSLYPELQSSYRQHHSTETALLKVMNDVLLNMNSQQVTLKLLLVRSAAFDTVNHDILLERLDKDIGMRGVTLDWFQRKSLRTIFDISIRMDTHVNHVCKTAFYHIHNSCSSVYSLRLFLDRLKERMLSTLGARSFYASASTLRNSLPANIREKTSLSNNITQHFKKKLETHLFNLAYNE